jgi:hypothetical protein
MTILPQECGRRTGISAATASARQRELTIQSNYGQTKKPIRVTRFGKPVADVVPPAPAAGPADWLGSLADTMEILGDIVSPVFEESDWEALRD